MTERKWRFALLGGVCGAAYFAHQFLGLPNDFFRGFVISAAACLLLLALLPQNVLEKLEKLKPWKHHGE